MLVDFPIAGQKSIGFLTRTLTDSETGKELAAVLLPNAINPTSAFLQVLPLERVTETDLTMEQAMSMLMTGGAVGPETIRFTQPVGCPKPSCSAATAVSAAVSLAALLRRVRSRLCTLRRLTCSICAQIRPTGTMPRNVTSSSVAAQAVAASGATPKKLRNRAATSPICVNQPSTGNWTMLVTPLTTISSTHLAGVIDASAGWRRRPASSPGRERQSAATCRSRAGCRCEIGERPHGVETGAETRESCLPRPGPVFFENTPKASLEKRRNHAP